MKKFRLTDKWPDPYRGKIAKQTVGNEFVYFSEFNDGYITQWNEGFIEKNLDLFEQVKEYEFEVIEVFRLDMNRTFDSFNIFCKGEKPDKEEVLKALNQYFNNE